MQLLNCLSNSNILLSRSSLIPPALSRFQTYLSNKKGPASGSLWQHHTRVSVWICNSFQNYRFHFKPGERGFLECTETRRRHRCHRGTSSFPGVTHGFPCPLLLPHHPALLLGDIPGVRHSFQQMGGGCLRKVLLWQPWGSPFVLGHMQWNSSSGMQSPNSPTRCFQTLGFASGCLAWMKKDFSCVMYERMK